MARKSISRGSSRTRFGGAMGHMRGGMASAKMSMKRLKGRTGKKGVSYGRS